ncbi:MAG: phage terminase large subunit, partial [Christensenella sp.]
MSVLKIEQPYKKQMSFFEEKTKYVAYGGARGGGKSWAARIKVVLLALNYGGIQMLLLRRTLPELRENHVVALVKLLKGVARYKESTREFIFPNQSRLKLGYCDTEKDVLQYQGQAYDVIIMEEATQFTEFQYQTLTESNRSSGMCAEKFSPRMYLTCNPGGVGHAWVKRLFIDKHYIGSERAEDYAFIPAKVYDNKHLMEKDPEYVRVLENISDPARRAAMLDGDWDIFIGQYFTEFKRDIHVIKPFVIPEHWRRYVTMDYGLDMLACYFIAMDECGNAYVYKEIYETGLMVTDAAARIAAMTNERIDTYYAPPDLWNRHADTGKSTAEIFAECGIYLARAQNDRVQGWYNLHEWLKPFTDEQGKQSARLRIFENCGNLIRTLPALRYDEKNPNDCAR